MTPTNPDTLWIYGIFALALFLVLYLIVLYTLHTGPRNRRPPTPKCRAKLDVTIDDDYGQILKFKRTDNTPGANS